MQNILVTFLYQILNYLQEVETSEKNAFTKRIDGARNKITKARSDLRVRVRLHPNTEKIVSHFPLHRLACPLSNPKRSFPPTGRCSHKTVTIYWGGEMLRKIKCKIKGIKYCSEPELKGGDCAHGHAPDRCGSRACSEGPECAGYVNIEARGGQSACPPSSLLLFWELRFFFLVDMNVHEHWTFSFKLETINENILGMKTFILLIMLVKPRVPSVDKQVYNN